MLPMCRCRGARRNDARPSMKTGAMRCTIISRSRATRIGHCNRGSASMSSMVGATLESREAARGERESLAQLTESTVRAAVKPVGLNSTKARREETGAAAGSRRANGGWMRCIRTRPELDRVAKAVGPPLADPANLFRTGGITHIRSSEICKPSSWVLQRVVVG
ncbi:hypothetical protein BKA62DRAFT_702137 [Auriculariales sp. MPI-PUGE-AT-0066]|nr:hypothetical protein BKA62DRAFT_702137 [Auriculariales sp. MPI-PUGE-AT-0066]